MGCASNKICSQTTNAISRVDSQIKIDSRDKISQKKEPLVKIKKKSSQQDESLNNPELNDEKGLNYAGKIKNKNNVVNFDTGIINHKKPKSVTDKKLISLDNLMD